LSIGIPLKTLVVTHRKKAMAGNEDFTQKNIFVTATTESVEQGK
jgi:hypothetical protein